ncbi:hexitol phosphatase HxpB [Parvicella tangerina]|uniref:Hexitol phosphatase B n=1 Tax=Parvicella tangerina TaxID=2829795 RepID=A0A916JN35_9FLAO|nr:hexitol phosphatase HxpB [Parvicella tangerina]CAG5082586.1 Hexitol phosphatase B [Parvicella tangerina]
MKAHIFDMDGLLIDSEPFWRAAEIKVFSSLGIPFNEEMCRQTVGMRIDEVVNYWNNELALNMPIHSTANNIVDELISLVKRDGIALPGVYATLENLKANDRKIALASSSQMRIIEEVTEKLNIQDFFSVLHSAEFEKYGKPSPDVFLTTAKKLGVSPMECVVYEDSKNGMRAGIAAKMKTIIIPEFPEPHLSWHDEADIKWSSLEKFSLELSET